MSEGNYSEGSQLVAAGATLVKVTHEAMQAVSIQRPRDLEKINQAIIAELDRVQEWAIRGFYRKPVGDGVMATGPSVYLTRIVARNFGNCSVRSYLAHQSDEIIQLSGVFLDLESNYLAERMQTVSAFAWRKGRGDAKGYYETLVGEKLMQAILIGASKAERNAVSAGVPDWIMQAAFAKCQKLASDDTKKQLSKMVQTFATLGVSTEALVRHFDGEPLEKLSDDQYADLRGLATGIQNRDISPADIGALPGDELPAEHAQASDTATLDGVLEAGAAKTGGRGPEADDLAGKLTESLKPDAEPTEEASSPPEPESTNVVPITPVRKDPGF